MLSAEQLSGRGRDPLDLVQTFDLLARKPLPCCTGGAFRATPASSIQARRNRRGGLRRQPGDIEVRRSQEKILGKDRRIRLKRYHAPGKRFKLPGESIAQAFKAKRNFRPDGFPPVDSFTAKIQRVWQYRGDPTDIVPQVDTFGSSSL